MNPQTQNALRGFKSYVPYSDFMQRATAGQQQSPRPPAQQQNPAQQASGYAAYAPPARQSAAPYRAYSSPQASAPAVPRQSQSAPVRQQDPAASIRNLLQGYNIPQNVMDQIGGMFGGQQGGGLPLGRPDPPPGQAGSQPPAPGRAQPIQDPYASSAPAGGEAQSQPQAGSDKGPPDFDFDARLNELVSKIGYTPGVPQRIADMNYQNAYNRAFEQVQAEQRRATQGPRSPAATAQQQAQMEDLWESVAGRDVWTETGGYREGGLSEEQARAMQGDPESERFFEQLSEWRRTGEVPQGFQVPGAVSRAATPGQAQSVQDPYASAAPAGAAAPEPGRLSGGKELKQVSDLLKGLGYKPVQQSNAAFGLGGAPPEVVAEVVEKLRAGTVNSDEGLQAQLRDVATQRQRYNSERDAEMAKRAAEDSAVHYVQVMNKDRFGRPAGFKTVPAVKAGGGYRHISKQEERRLLGQRPAAPQPAAPRNAALPAGLQSQQWARQPDGSYRLASSPQTNSKRFTKPQTINWGSMPADELAKVRSPYVGGRWPTVRTPDLPDAGATSSSPPARSAAAAQSVQDPYAASTRYGSNRQGNPAMDSPLTPSVQNFMPQSPVDPSWGSPASQQQMYNNSMMAWTMPKQDLLQWGQQASQMPWSPNYGNLPDQFRPSPYSIEPNNAFGVGPQGQQNRDAYIQSIINAQSNQFTGTYQGQGNPGRFNQVNYDPSALWQQATGLMNQGFVNPFMPGG